MITKKIGPVAYTLQLPSSSKIHPTFHVSQLKKHHGLPPTHPDPHSFLTPDPTEVKQPVAVIDKRTVKRGHHAVTQWLVHWSNTGPEEVTWEDAAWVEEQFPQFDPWGQGSAQGGGIDTSINLIQGEESGLHAALEKGEKIWHKWTKREDDWASAGGMNPAGEGNTG